jgi:hypothetical protein
MINFVQPGSVAGRISGKIITGLLLFALTILFSAAMIYVRNADFKGDWTFNESKSKLAEGRFRMAAQKLKVGQDDASLTIERTSVNQNGENVTSTEKLTFDGKEAESTVFGNSKKKSTAAWGTGGNDMTIHSTINFERDGNSFEIKITEVWKLINDGKSLSIDYTSVSQRGTTNQTFVYDKN